MWCSQTLSTTTGRDRASAVAVANSRFYLTSLVPGLTILSFGMGTRLLVRMRTKLQIGVLCNGQQPQSVVNGFIDQSEVEVMKTLIGCRDPRYDKDQFRAKMTVST